MEEKYLVANVDARKKKIALLKSNLYTMTLDDFIVEAIDQFSGKVKLTHCHHCQQENVVTTKKDKVIEVSIAGKEHTINIKNYPRNICKLCDNVYENAKVSYYLNELIHEEINFHLKNKKPIPKDIDFNDLIKMDRSILDKELIDDNADFIIKNLP